MKALFAAGLLLALLVGVAPARAADEPRIENLALCRESWLDWKTSDPAKLDSAGAFFRSGFTHADNDAFLTPRSPTTIIGLKVAQLYPESVGMGVGFSVIVDATFDVAKAAVERALGKPLGGCESSDGMRGCELPIAKQRTVVVMSGDPPNDKTSLVGCYYLYEK